MTAAAAANKNLYPGLGYNKTSKHFWLIAVFTIKHQNQPHMTCSVGADRAACCCQLSPLVCARRKATQQQQQRYMCWLYCHQLHNVINVINGVGGPKVPEAQGLSGNPTLKASGSNAGFFDWRQLRFSKLTGMAFILKANQKSCWHAATCRSDLREDIVRNSFQEKKQTLHKNTRRTWPKIIQQKPIACTQRAILCPLSCPGYEVVCCVCSALSCLHHPHPHPTQHSNHCIVLA